MRINRVLPLAIIINTSALASSIIHDTDGTPGRVTYYNQTALNVMVTQSSSAYDIRVYAPYPGNELPCHHAEIFEKYTHTHLADVQINGSILTAQLERGHEHKEKYIEVQCIDNSNLSVRLRHNIAPAPKIKLKSKMTASHWQDGDHLYPGFYQDVRYQATLNIDNSEETGFCTASSIESDAPLKLGPWHSDGFINDIISFDEPTYYDARTATISAQIICRNTGGTTRMVETWKLNQNNITRNISTYIN
ncbi:hypothetical protein L1077_15365 [Pseudoalteromonas luteoviolacea]|uniref:hypothetical protein n=1 Tax=Pseudoalteromonas luteoviolacea TaxID=43657 RepID=UPI001F21D64F|nr:hypothetical protein [Pseudoalteromonas luteoviolacea]MCF6440815.1 hypothetical protein [Pseudoalteromonas luteoviolacea]